MCLRDYDRPVVTDSKQLERGLQNLEDRVRKLKDGEWVEQLYQKAREIVKKYHKSSVIFLQRELLMGYEESTIRIYNTNAGDLDNSGEKGGFISWRGEIFWGAIKFL